MPEVNFRDQLEVSVCSMNIQVDKEVGCSSITVHWVQNSTAKLAEPLRRTIILFTMYSLIIFATINGLPMKWRRGKLNFCVKLASYYIDYRLRSHAVHYLNTYLTQDRVFLILYYRPYSQSAFHLQISYILSENFDFLLSQLMHLSPIPYLKVISLIASTSIVSGKEMGNSQL